MKNSQTGSNLDLHSNKKTNSIFSKETIDEVFSTRVKQPKEYKNINTETYCKYSGILIQIDNIFAGKQNIRCAEHWMFSQNPITILSYMMSAKSAEQKWITQLAALKTLDCMQIDYPIQLPVNAVHNLHTKLCDLFIAYLNCSDSIKTKLRKSIPTLNCSVENKVDPPYYTSFVNTIYDRISYNLDSSPEVVVSNLLDTPAEILTSEMKDEFIAYAKARNLKYSKGIGKEVLSTLATQDSNSELIKDYELYRSYLLNDSFSRPDNLAAVFKVILESTCPYEDSDIQQKVSVTLKYLALRIELILEAEQGYFGKRTFNYTKGTISKSSIIFNLQEAAQVQDMNPSKKKLAFKIVLDDMSDF